MSNIIKIEFTEAQAKELALIMDAALKGSGLHMVRQVHYWADILDKAIDAASKAKEDK